MLTAGRRRERNRARARKIIKVKVESGFRNKNSRGMKHMWALVTKAAAMIN